MRLRWGTVVIVRQGWRQSKSAKIRAWAFVTPELWCLATHGNSTTKALSRLRSGEGIGTAGRAYNGADG
jgi:hypothetical protein